VTAGIGVLCRHDSRRLPGKILRELRGRTVLGHIVDRLRRGAGESPIVVATSDDSSDDPIARYCRRSGLACFRGPLADVAGRFLACAEGNGWEFAVRINGDNLFTDPDALRAMLAIASTGQYDFVTNVPGRTFPFGMSIEIVRTSFYRDVMAGVRDAAHREHVTSWLYENPGIGRRHVFENRLVPEARGLQLALDTEADLQRCESMLARMGGPPASFGLAQVARLAAAEPAADPWQGRSGPYLIAEVGGNHEGDFARACELADLAIATGVDCVKFQIYRGDALVSARESPDRNAHFKRFELKPEQHLSLARRCEAAGVHYLASVWDLESLEWIDPHLRMYKIGSGDLTAWPLLRAIAARGKPIVLSTGLATLDEVLQSVAQVQDVDARYRRPEWLCLLQCTSMYPIPDRDATLLAMEELRAATGLAVGYSDHTVGGTALRVAAAMGARVLEFHFTDRREGREFRDHKVSLMPDEVRTLQRDLLQVGALRGRAAKQPQPSEVEPGHLASFRRAVYCGRDVAAGERIAFDDLVVLRPNHGIDARDADLLVGRRARRALTAGVRLSWDDFEPGNPDV
jgi:sialic acid synthase SpsE/spore coat polysaccharide biosynthesis protein SpsF (cytidylyltransferase family)